MTVQPPPAAPPPADEPPSRRDNGLVASSYVPLTDVAVPVAPSVLVALGRARIAAYLAETPATSAASGALRLYVASGERADARTIVASVVRASGEQTQPADPLAGIDPDAEFARLVADWHVDTHHAIRDAEKQLTREDEDWRLRLNKPAPADETPWLDEQHYVPPAPPPLPRFAAPTIVAMAVLAMSIVILAFGGEFGMASRLVLLLGVLGVLLGAGMLIMRLREHRDDDDDGAVL
jgi:hypothetical protein